MLMIRSMEQIRTLEFSKDNDIQEQIEGIQSNIAQGLLWIWVVLSSYYSILLHITPYDLNFISYHPCIYDLNLVGSQIVKTHFSNIFLWIRFFEKLGMLKWHGPSKINFPLILILIEYFCLPQLQDHLAIRILALILSI